MIKYSWAIRINHIYRQKLKILKNKWFKMRVDKTLNNYRMIKMNKIYLH
jgi:hypothetical protein